MANNSNFSWDWGQPYDTFSTKNMAALDTPNSIYDPNASSDLSQPGDIVSGPGAHNGFNWKTFGDIMNTVGNLGKLYLGFQQLNLGKKQFGFAKDSFNTNLANESQAYNTNLRAQERARMQAEGTLDRNSQAFKDALNTYVNNNKVSGAKV